MRLADYLALGFMGFFGLALIICATGRVRDVASRAGVRSVPIRGQQPGEVPPDAQAVLDELLGEPAPSWWDNDQDYRKAGVR